jgi:hypothetical protein
LLRYAASNLYLIRGDWAKARSLIERWIAVLRTGKVASYFPTGSPSAPT